jgi:hypothetical protein
VYLSGTAAMVTGPGLDSGIGVYSRRSQEQGLPAWAPSDVQAPARHRLYRAVAAELSVLRPGGVDSRTPVALDSVAALAPGTVAGISGKQGWPKVRPPIRGAGPQGCRTRCPRGRPASPS